MLDSILKRQQNTPQEPSARAQGAPQAAPLAQAKQAIIDARAAAAQALQRLREANRERLALGEQLAGKGIDPEKAVECRRRLDDLRTVVIPMLEQREADARRALGAAESHHAHLEGERNRVQQAIARAERDTSTGGPLHLKRRELIQQRAEALATFDQELAEVQQAIDHAAEQIPQLQAQLAALTGE